MKRLALALALALAACNTSTGTRHSMPDYKLGKWNLYWWALATSTERAWIIEAASEHRALLNADLNGEPVPETNVILYRARRELAVARASVQSNYGITPAYHTSGLQFSGIGFLHPWTNAVHIWAGNKLECDQLAHLMLHAVIADEVQHLDPRWPRLVFDDYLLSVGIAARR